MITVHIAQIYIMDDCPYQYPIFMFIIWLYGSVFLVLFLHFWYHAYTKGQRLPKMAKNGISKDQWKIHTSLGLETRVYVKMETCTTWQSRYLGARTTWCIFCMFSSKIEFVFFTISYLGFRISGVGGSNMDLWFKRKGVKKKKKRKREKKEK